MRPSNDAVLNFERYLHRLQQQYAWMAPALLARYARAYGSRVHALLAGRKMVGHMGEEIAPGLFAAEVEYLVSHEWAACAEDILWRRSKLGLHVPPDTAEKLDAWIAARKEKSGLQHALAV